MPKLTVTICFWVLYFELTIISFAALLRVEAAGLFRSAPSWIHLPVLMSLFVTDLLILRQRVLCSDILHSLCCDCAVSVLTLCRSVLCSSGIWFWEVQCSSWPPVQHRPHQGAPESRADFHSFQVLKSHFSLLGYSVTPAAFLNVVCVYGPAHAPTYIQTQILWSFLCFSLVLSCLCASFLCFLCTFPAGSWPDQWCFD